MLLELARNFLSIPNLVHQEAICDLARTLKDQDVGTAPETDSRAS